MKKRLFLQSFIVAALISFFAISASAASNQDVIWDYFKAQGFSDAGVAGIMGNLEAESGYYPNNLEDAAETKSGYTDQRFTNEVNSGAISRSQFISSTKFGLYSYTDAGKTYYTYGYGLAQWTFYSRKAALYDFAKSKGKNIDDLNMQLQFIMYEMNASLKSYLKTATNVSEACVKFHNIYEGSADTASMIANRVQKAETVYKKYHVECTHDYSSIGKCGKCGEYFDHEATLDTSKAAIYEAVVDHYTRTSGPYSAASRVSSQTKIGTEITVLGAVKNSYGNTWYKTKDGYISANWATKVRDIPSEISVSITWPSEGQVIPKAAHNLEGTITSAVNIKTAKVYVDGTYYGTDKPNKTTFSLAGSNMDYGLPFNELSTGEHTLKIVVTDINGGTKTVSRVFYTEKKTNTKPTELTIGTNKTTMTLDDSIVITPTATNAKNYSVSVWYGDYSTGESVLLNSYFTGSMTFVPEKPGTYTIRADAHNSAGDVSTEKTFNVTLEEPDNLTSSILPTSGGIRLTWSAVSGATHYAVYRSTSKDGTYTKLATTTLTAYEDTSGTPGTCYYYKVSAGADKSMKYESPKTGYVYRTRDCAKPTNVTLTRNSSGKPVLKWSAVSGANQYEVYRKVGENGTYTKYYTTTGTSLTNNSTEPGKTYYYKVVATRKNNSAATSAYSQEVGITAKCAKPSVSATTDAATGNIKLSWNKVSGATRYYIYRSTSKNGTYRYYDSTTGTSYTNSSTTPGVTYYYKVRAICGTSSYGNSEVSSYVYITRDCAAPTVTISRNSSGKPVLTWKKVDGASKYYIYRYDSASGAYKYYYTTTSTSFTNSSAVKGKTYYYKVQAICGTSSYGNSALSTAKSITAR